MAGGGKKQGGGRVTQAAVAEHLGMAKSTVAMILSGHPHAKRYSEATRRKVLQGAIKLNYRPDFFASQLNAANRRLISLVTSSLGDTYAAVVASAFQRQCAESGYQLLVSALEWSDRSSDEPILPPGITALAVLGSYTQCWLHDEQLLRLADDGYSIVLIGRDIDHPSIASVNIDDDAAAGSAAGYLYDQGVVDLWLITGVADVGVFRRRADGVRRVARERGMPEPKSIHIEQSDVHISYDVVSKHLAGASPPHGVLGVTDNLAVGAMNALIDAGRTPGRDVSVIAFNDMFLPAVVRPKLAAVRVPTFEMGRIAASLLIDMYRKNEVAERRVILDAPLIVRESIAHKARDAS
jgi:DNA-binding LacI/PurR family transcriptional regulator